jgi:hypothetical protein
MALVVHGICALRDRPERETDWPEAGPAFFESDEEECPMPYVVTEIMDDIELLQAHVDGISKKRGRVVSVLWRESDRAYVVTHEVEAAEKQSRSQKAA